MSIEGQGHFFTICFPGFVCFVLYLDKISGERLQDHWSSGSIIVFTHADQLLSQLLIEHFDTLPTQCRHIEHMHEGLLVPLNELLTKWQL